MIEDIIIQSFAYSENRSDKAEELELLKQKGKRCMFRKRKARGNKNALF